MTIWLGREAASVITGQANEMRPLETGGILLGWRDGNDRVVVDVVGPGNAALHGRTKFIPDHSWQVQQINRIFEETSGDIDYLGDWHTHPTGTVRMSAEDHVTLKRIAKKIGGAVMLIASPVCGQGWTFGGWIQARPGILRSANPAPHDIRLFDIPPSWPRATAI